MSVCLLAGAKAVVLASAAFTLSWTHSVEKVRWEEDWLLTPAGLQIVEARVSGTGAGMEIPDGAVLKGGAWIYRPAVAPQARLVLARSGATVGGWRVCSARGCTDIPESPGMAAVEIGQCP